MGRGFTLESRREPVDIEACLAAGQTVQFPIRGWSMYPLLTPGRDSVIVAPVKLEILRRGDAALYRRDGGILVLHRIWRVRDGGIWFVGDNQKEVEGPLRPDQVRGVMTAAIRKGRRIEVTDLRCRLYSRLWLLLRPLRPAISRAIHALRTRRGGAG